MVAISSLKRFILSKKGKVDYAYLLVHNMSKAGEIKKIAKGFYSIHEDPVISVYCFKPSYIGLQSALSIHNLWEQETIPVVITSKKIRQGIRVINDNNILLHRISPKYFFGLDYIKENDFYIPVSDVEKTFIDMIYFKQKMDKELLKNFKKRMDVKKVEKYLKEYPRNISVQVNKFLLEGVKKNI